MNGQQDRPESEPEVPDQAAEQEQEAPESGTEAADAEATITKLQALADENWDKYLRAAAELENVRKRAMRDVEKAHKYALERFCTELLAVKDSLEMGVAAADKADAQSLLEGKEATLKLLATTMERFGVVELNPEGEPFNPEEHEAMTMQPSADVEPGSVLTVFQKGYALNGRLLPGDES
jgi:molecular chaperone GrpE